MIIKNIKLISKNERKITMPKIKIFIISSIAMFFFLTVTGICFAERYKKVKPQQSFEVTFADSEWDRKNVPKGQQCLRFKGNGSTPRLTIKNIPAGTNAIIMEFSDRDSNSMNFGGHGKVGYYIEEGVKEIIIPSVPGHTFDLPEKFFKVAAHKLPSWDKAGVYMPPCSGGKGHRYYVTIKAVYKDPNGKSSKLFGKEKLEMGRY